jgi:hypothetical protein
VGSRDLAGLRHCMADLGLRRGFVVCGAEERRRLDGGIELVPRSAVARGDFELPQ